MDFAAFTAETVRLDYAVYTSPFSCSEKAAKSMKIRENENSFNQMCLKRIIIYESTVVEAKNMSFLCIFT